VNRLLFRRGEWFSILAALLMLLCIGIFSTIDWIEYHEIRDQAVAARITAARTNALLIAITDAKTA
jgi:hypothetical protein